MLSKRLSTLLLCHLYKYSDYFRMYRSLKWLNRNLELKYNFYDALFIDCSKETDINFEYTKRHSIPITRINYYITDYVYLSSFLKWRFKTNFHFFKKKKVPCSKGTCLDINRFIILFSLLKCCTKKIFIFSLAFYFICNWRSWCRLSQKIATKIL